MDIASEAKRRSVALDRIVMSAEAIGSELGLDNLTTTLTTTHHRVPQYKQLFQLEAVADLLEVVAREVAPDYMPNIDATPSALERAEQEGVDLTQVEGTGADGRILVSDVVAAVELNEQERELAEVMAARQRAFENTTDAALKYALERNIDLTKIQGTGANGKIVLDDVKAATGE